jgi:thymidylate synthase
MVHIYLIILKSTILTILKKINMDIFKIMLNTVLKQGIKIPPARANMPSTIFYNSLHGTFKFDKGLPILTAKRMPFYSILGELVGFMKGLTDVREYDKLGCKVWWDNAFKWNVIDEIKDIPSFKTRTLQEYKDNKIISAKYDLGRIYAAQWRRYIGIRKTKTDNVTQIDYDEVDQLKQLIESILNTPTSRYHVITAWNPTEMNNTQVSQPNCHVYFQASGVPKEFTKREIRNYLSKFLTQSSITELLDNGYKPNKLLYTHLTQRSCDMFLGVPFNITSYSLFTILLCIFTNSIPVEFEWTGVNAHIYSNHVDQCKSYLKNYTHTLPKLDIKGIYSLKDIEGLNTLADLKEHFKLVDYKHSGNIKADLSVGL